MNKETKKKTDIIKSSGWFSMKLLDNCCLNCKRYAIHFLLIIFLSSSCIENESPSNSIISSTQDTLAMKKETQSSNLLDIYFQNPLNFDEYKSERKEMLNCGKASPTLLKPDSIGLYYSYCFFNAMAGKNKIKSFDNNEPLITFHTWKKSLKGKEGYYNAKNETLLGIQCAIQDEKLAQSDWVEKDSIFIVEKLGQPMKIGSGQFYYFIKNKILILNFKKNKVTWYKFFLLAKPVQISDFSNNEFIKWT